MSNTTATHSDDSAVPSPDEYLVLQYVLKGEGVKRLHFCDTLQEAITKANKLRSEGHKACFWNLAGKPANGKQRDGKRFGS